VANSALLQEVRRSLQSSPGKRPHLATLAPNRLGPAAREPCERSMTFQISRRGKEYLETAQTLLRAARTMSDRAIAGQLQALADDYQRRAEKASHVDTAQALVRAAAAPNASGVPDWPLHGQPCGRKGRSAFGPSAMWRHVSLRARSVGRSGLMSVGSLLATSLVRMHPMHYPAHLRLTCATLRLAPPLLRGSVRMDRTCAALD